MSRACRSRGFTLIELMVTVAIIGIALAAAVPSIQQAMRDRRLQQQAINFMAPFREARSRALMRGAAQLVAVRTTTGDTSEKIWEGEASSCSLSNFSRVASQLVAVNDALADGEVRVANTSPGQAVIEFCFTPSGRMLFRYDSSSAFTDDNTGLQGGFLFTVSNPAYPATVVRKVFVSLGGIPRLSLQ